MIVGPDKLWWISSATWYPYWFSNIICNIHLYRNEPTEKCEISPHLLCYEAEKWNTSIMISQNKRNIEMKLMTVPHSLVMHRMTLNSPALLELVLVTFWKRHWKQQRRFIKWGCMRLRHGKVIKPQNLKWGVSRYPCFIPGKLIWN